MKDINIDEIYSEYKKALKLQYAPLCINESAVKSIEYLRRIFATNPLKYTVDFENELKHVFIRIGTYEGIKDRVKSTHFIFIIAPYLGGKTQLINTLYAIHSKWIEEGKSKLTAKLIPLNRFGVDSNTVFSQISDVDVVYIDNVHYIKDLDNFLLRLADSFDGVCIMTIRPPWYLHIYGVRNKLLGKIGIDEIFIHTIDSKYSGELFTKVYSVIKMIDKMECVRINESIFSRIFNNVLVTGNKIRAYLEFLDRYAGDIQFKINKGIKVDEEIYRMIDEFLEHKGYSNKYYKKLIDMSVYKGASVLGKRIFEVISMFSEPEMGGITPYEVIEILFAEELRGLTEEKKIEIKRRKAPKIVHHLSRIAGFRLVFTRREGKNVFYKFRDEILPYVDLLVMSELLS